MQETPVQFLGLFALERIDYPLQYSLASLVIQLVKNPPALRNTWVRSWVGKIPWRREWLPTPVLWPGEFHGLYSPWGRKESDTTERLSLSRKNSTPKFHYKCHILNGNHPIVKVIVTVVTPVYFFLIGLFYLFILFYFLTLQYCIGFAICHSCLKLSLKGISVVQWTSA